MPKNKITNEQLYNNFAENLYSKINELYIDEELMDTLSAEEYNRAMLENLIAGGFILDGNKQPYKPGTTIRDIFRDSYTRFEKVEEERELSDTGVNISGNVIVTEDVQAPDAKETVENYVSNNAFSLYVNGQYKTFGFNYSGSGFTENGTLAPKNDVSQASYQAYSYIKDTVNDISRSLKGSRGFFDDPNPAFDDLNSFLGELSDVLSQGNPLGLTTDGRPDLENHIDYNGLSRAFNGLKAPIDRFKRSGLDKDSSKMREKRAEEISKLESLIDIISKAAEYQHEPGDDNYTEVQDAKKMQIRSNTPLEPAELVYNQLATKVLLRASYMRMNGNDGKHASKDRSELIYAKAVNSQLTSDPEMVREIINDKDFRESFTNYLGSLGKSNLNDLLKMSTGELAGGFVKSDFYNPENYFGSAVLDAESIVVNQAEIDRQNGPGNDFTRIAERLLFSLATEMRADSEVQTLGPKTVEKIIIDKNTQEEVDPEQIGAAAIEGIGTYYNPYRYTFREKISGTTISKEAKSDIYYIISHYTTPGKLGSLHKMLDDNKTFKDAVREYLKASAGISSDAKLSDDELAAEMLGMQPDFLDKEPRDISADFMTKVSDASEDFYGMFGAIKGIRNNKYAVTPIKPVTEKKVTYKSENELKWGLKHSEYTQKRSEVIAQLAGDEFYFNDDEALKIIQTKLSSGELTVNGERLTDIDVAQVVDRLVGEPPKAEAPARGDAETAQMLKDRASKAIQQLNVPNKSNYVKLMNGIYGEALSIISELDSHESFFHSDEYKDFRKAMDKLPDRMNKNWGEPDKMMKELSAAAEAAKAYKAAHIGDSLNENMKNRLMISQRVITLYNELSQCANRKFDDKGVEHFMKEYCAEKAMECHMRRTFEKADKNDRDVIFRADRTNDKLHRDASNYEKALCVPSDTFAEIRDKFKSTSDAFKMVMKEAANDPKALSELAFGQGKIDKAYLKAGKEVIEARKKETFAEHEKRVQEKLNTGFMKI